MTMKHNFSRWLAALAASAMVAGCAQSVGDINRVQPNVTKKADLLDGVWYYRNTVTWTPATTGFTYPGQTGMLEKIVFDIQEKQIIGYRAYPYIPGSEMNVDQTSKVTGTTVKHCDASGKCTGGQKYYGAPIVGFAIESHFDIQRGYNPGTGEVTNVISENGSDRPWNQREYIRVDWSANILNQNAGMNWGSVQNPAGGSSSASWIQANEKGEDPYDWPTWEHDADGKLQYFDVTGRYAASPGLYYYEGYGYIPMCWLSYQEDCSSSEIRMRMSFAKVDPVKSRDYEPLVYGNDLMTKFGYFRVERLNYDHKFGYTDSAIIRLATRYDVWKQSLVKDDQGQPDPTRAIPFAEREVKPIRYYLTPANRMGGQARYDEVRVPAKRLEEGWDKAFRRAVAASQGKKPEEAPQTLIVCDTPVRADQPACGKEGFEPRFGDLRYSFMYTIAEPVANGLLGYGPSSPDPETGEIISANANTYLWGIDRYGRSLLDTMDLLTGASDLKTYLSGDSVKDYISRNPIYSGQSSTNKNPLIDGTPAEAEIANIVDRVGPSLGAFAKPTQRAQEIMQHLKAAGGLTQASGDAVKVAEDIIAANPTLESALIDNPEISADLISMIPPQLQGYASKNPEFLRKAASKMLTNAGGAAAFEKERLAFISNNNMYMAEFFDRTLMSVALRETNTRANRIRELKASGNPTCLNVGSCTDAEALAIANEEVSMRLRQSVWQATSEHEIGHTFGLRHNFQGSFDAVNYFDKYWDLRKSTITLTQNGQQRLPRTTADIKKLVDNISGDPTLSTDSTVLQLANGMHDAEYSSIMDYSGKITGDWMGPGRYDEAAILFAYSGGSAPGYVEVFDAVAKDTKVIKGTDGLDVTLRGAGLDIPQVNAEHKHPGVPNYSERVHYSTIPLRFGTGPTVQAQIDDGVAKLRKRSIRKWSDVKVERDRIATLLQTKTQLDPTDVETTPMEVPYMFCTDDHVEAVLSCDRFDRGPDYYEITRTYLEDYWNYYYSSHFRRNRLTWSAYGALSGSFGTFLSVANVYRHWYFEFFGRQTATQQQFARYTVDPLMQDTWTMAVLDGINQHLNVSNVPNFGFYWLDTRDSKNPVWRWADDGDEYDDLSSEGFNRLKDYYSSTYQASSFAILPRGLGRRAYSRFDYKSGIGFERRIEEVGHYYDQIGAIYAAVYPYSDFLGIDYTADSFRYSIPYYSTFRTELTSNYSSLWAYDETVLRPTMYLTLTDTGKVGTKPNLAWKRYVSGSDYVTAFDYPRATDVKCTMNDQTGCLHAGTTTIRGAATDQKPAPLDISLTWTSRYLSLLYGSALFRSNYDFDFLKTVQVFKLGGAEQQSVAQGFHTVEVQDIGTGARYVAIEQDGAPENSTAAIRKVNLSKQLLQVVNDPTLCPMPVLANYTGCMPRDQITNPSLVEARRRQYKEFFRDSIRDLDLMRNSYQAFGKAF